MSRATPLSPDDRRRAIIEATLPLLLDRGPEISTREIARAAGIAEGTIFRAFGTKHDLIHATVHAALAPDAAIAELAALPPDQTLSERAVSILVVLHDEIQRTRALFATLFGDRDPHPPGGRRHPPAGDDHPKHRLARAATEALAPYAAELRVPVADAGRVLSTLAIALGFGSTDPHLTDADRLADVVLYGIAQGEA